MEETEEERLAREAEEPAAAALAAEEAARLEAEQAERHVETVRTIVTEALEPVHSRLTDLEGRLPPRETEEERIARETAEAEAEAARAAENGDLARQAETHIEEVVPKRKRWNLL